MKGYLVTKKPLTSYFYFFLTWKCILYNNNLHGLGDMAVLLKTCTYLRKINRGTEILKKKNSVSCMTTDTCKSPPPEY